MASLEPQPSLPRWSPKDCFGFRLTDSDGLESKAKKDSRKKKKKPITSSEDGPSPSIDLVHRSKSESLTNGTAQEQPPTETVLEPGVTDAVRSSSNDVEPGIEEERVEERHPRPVSIPINGRDQTSISEHAELARRFEALASEREELRNEVEKLRISLEAVTEQHRTEVSTLQSSLTAAQQDKDASDSNYRSLVGKVNTIRASLGERLKADAAELEVLRTRNEQLEENTTSLKEANDQLTDELAALTSGEALRSKQLSDLQSHNTVSQQSWARERGVLEAEGQGLRRQLQAATQSIQDWEIVALEERAARAGLTDKVAELEDRLAGARITNEALASERHDQSQTVDGLQRALRDIQEARRTELRELAESTQTQLETIKTQREASIAELTIAQTELSASRAEIERLLPFEKEIKEKNLLIGKLRHEAVVLNDHLTKALRFLKKGRPEDNVDKHIVTNHFLQFLGLDRADPKKFQVLQLIGALLSWTEEEREQAGLSRPGTTTSAEQPPSLRTTTSYLLPFSRRPSSQSLTPTSSYALDSPVGSNSKESLAELWSSFLEQESGGLGGQVVQSPSGMSEASRPGSSREQR